MRGGSSHHLQAVLGLQDGAGPPLRSVREPMTSQSSVCFLGKKKALEIPKAEMSHLLGILLFPLGFPGLCGLLETAVWKDAL